MISFPTRAARVSVSARAFTLIELLTVIAIIGILAAILIPTVGKVRESARKAQSTGNLRNVFMAISNHANDHKQLLVAANSSRIDPDFGTAYGSWGNQLTKGGYTSVKAPSTTENTLMGCPQQLSQFPESLNNMATSGYYTYAMNARVGHQPSPVGAGEHGARRMTEFVTPSRSALIMHGIWNGTAFSRTTREDTYVTGMNAGVSKAPFNGDTVLVLFAAGNVQAKKLSEIPTDRTSAEGIEFWLGGVIR